MPLKQWLGVVATALLGMAVCGSNVDGANERA